MYNLILAIDKDNLVGSTTAKFGLPWHYPEDLKFYKKMTTGKKCVMGRKTYEAIGSALPNRETYVLTTDEQYQLNDATVIHDFKQLGDQTEWWICGGVNVFKQFLPTAQNIYITRIDESHTGDVYFHDLDLSGFTLQSKTSGENPKLTFEKWIKNED